MKRALVVGSVALVLVLTGVLAVASDAEMYFSSDRNGQNRVTDIQEGDSIWIVVYDPDENIDCDVRDKIWTDIKVMDPKTGAYITWISYLRGGPIAGQAYDLPGYLPFQGHEPGNALGDLRYDYLEETGADTGLFVSARSFQVGTRELVLPPIVPIGLLPENLQTHVVDNNIHPDPLNTFLGATILMADFNFGNYTYNGAGVRGYIDGTGAFIAGALLWGIAPWDIATLPAARPLAVTHLEGHFENMDSLIGLYVDQNDASDVACAMGKIIDTEASCSWDQRIYPDCNASASITIVDPDENLDCNSAEFVPVFVIVNPGSWNPVDYDPVLIAGGVSPTTFCALKRTGGVVPLVGGSGFAPVAPNLGVTIQPWNIYNSQILVPAVPADINNLQTHVYGTYYIEYPTTIEGFANVVAFDMTDLNGVVRCMFWAQETGPNTGEFQLNINSICNDLGFNSLNVNDVLVAYYLDPNDFDDFTLCVAYITEDTCHSATSFTDAMRLDMEEYWIGRNPVYVQVIDSNANVDPCCPEQVIVHICDPHEIDDSEWVILDEIGTDSPAFFTNNGYQLLPVWDALGVGIIASGFQLRLDNWKIEVFNEDDVYARYNDAVYVAGVTGLAGLGDITAVSTTVTAFPPQIRQLRVPEDVSFDTFDVGDTQVFEFGGTMNMWFMDAEGNDIDPALGYTNSAAVFVKVFDWDQNEDVGRRERIDGYWDHRIGAMTTGQNWPFGPENAPAPLVPGFPVHDIIIPGAFAVGIGTNITNMLGTAHFQFPGVGAIPFLAGVNEWAKLYVLNPRNGLWAPVDLLEDDVNTGVFVSTVCIDLVSQWPGVPTLGVVPGDTIIAVYQDPSNHSDSAWICIKVGCGGAGPGGGERSTTMFVDADGVEVQSYTDADDIYVKVTDPSHTGATLNDAVAIDGVDYDLMKINGAYMTNALALGLADGATITATYTDPSDPTDTSSDTISILASVLEVFAFEVGPNPFETDVVFSYDGTGVASVFTVTIYDLTGKLVKTISELDTDEVTWNGVNGDGQAVGKGAYIYVIEVENADGTYTKTEKDVLVRK